MQNNSDIKNFLSELGLKNIENIEQDLGSGYVRLRISEAERRQALQDIKCVEDIVVELLRNSRDAESSNIYIATKKSGDSERIIYFIDDGRGIPSDLKDLIFEARVTSKLENARKDIYGFHGRGMALFSIKLNVEEIYLTFSRTGAGSSFFLRIDLSKIPEKKDQSVFPEIVELDGNISIIGGLNNIPKNLVEFKLQNQEINLYYGAPSQIILSMRNNAKSMDMFDLLPKFNDFEEVKKYIEINEDLKLVHYPCLTNNYNVLSGICSDFFKMNISDRSIQRIIYEEFEPLNPINLEQLVHLNRKKNNGPEEVGEESPGKEKNAPKIYEDQKLSSRFEDDEIKYIMNALVEKINTEGQKHLIRVRDNFIAKRNNNIQINIELEEIN
ncbi:MAG TPA: ATP-binding protein [Actinobacteria bacterium]|nr:ATP-binding protein [Actinomycetota bacterium]